MAFLPFERKGWPRSTHFEHYLEGNCGFSLTVELAAGALSREAVLFLKVGLCGGFTTFSTFSLETLELIEGGQYAIAGAYALVSVVLCVAGVLVGKVLARALMPTG